jgi:sigma-54 dependent transcriptional regulator, flagellar regulatory protein
MSLDRRFLSLVARAAFANPFSEERDRLDAEIGETDARDPHVLARASARLSSRLEGIAKLAKYGAEDREILFPAILFAVFHRYIDELDRLIETPGKVRFAATLLADLEQRGVEPRVARRALELFYQMRRAHLAIGRRLVGGGPSMRKLREALWNSVFTHDVLRYERTLWSRLEDFSTLLIGDTGTGKGEAARAIGRAGFIPFDEARGEFAARADSLFVPLNLSAYAESLIEAELFGHRRGAFTGAIDDRPGALSRVPAHGTLFLDEIGEVAPAIQVKLLRVLQERTFVPVGAREELRFSGRVVAATHRSLSSLRGEGRMRDDFYYRIATHTIELPSLHQRLQETPQELALLVAHSCTQIAGEPAPELAATVVEVIERELGPNHPFPGNVRELEQCVRRVLLTGHCAGERAPARNQPLAAERARGELTAEQLVRAYCQQLYARSGSYVQVAQVTGLDRRTVRRYLTEPAGAARAAKQG